MLRATESAPFGDLISRRVPFVVPKYQRPYAWEEGEITDFIGDLKELYEKRSSDPAHPKKHFFGGIVTVERFDPNLSDMGNAFDVVDGQQRLATIMITMALLIGGLDELAQQASSVGDQETASKAESYASTTRKSYLEYTEVVGNRTQERVRLMLSKADAHFFENLVKGHISGLTPSRTSHERLRDTWNLLNKQLIQPILNNSSINYAVKIDQLLTLRSSVLQDCYFIHISSDNMGEAYRLFAILNDRGKTLSDGDLLRVYTLEMLEGHLVQQNHLEQCWDEILGHSFEEVRLFLRAYYPSHKGERAPSGDFVDKFREQFFNYVVPLSSKQAAELVSGVDQMRKEINVFLDVSEGNWPYENSTVSSWERSRLDYLIKVLKHSLCVPLLMSACQHLPESEFATLVGLLDRFSFRYINMVGAHPGSLGNLYYKQAVAIRSKGSSYRVANLQTELTKLQNANATDKLFEEAMRQNLHYTQSPRNIIRYFLTTIEYFLPWYNKGARGKPSPDTSRVFEPKLVNIEHIYPQRPIVSDLALDPLKHDIGNLTFWAPSDNVAAANLPFSDKKSLYSQSTVLLTRELEHLTNWNLSELEKRKDRLVMMAASIFTV